MGRVGRVFVDVHSHVVPSGDDGAQSIEEGLELCRGAAAHGTSVLVATPHVWPMLPLPPEREERERLDLDLPHAFTREAEAPADVLEGVRLLAAQAVAELEHAPVTFRER